MKAIIKDMDAQKMLSCIFRYLLEIFPTNDRVRFKFLIMRRFLGALLCLLTLLCIAHIGLKKHFIFIPSCIYSISHSEF